MAQTFAQTIVPCTEERGTQDPDLSVRTAMDITEAPALAIVISSRYRAKPIVKLPQAATGSLPDSSTVIDKPEAQVNVDIKQADDEVLRGLAKPDIKNMENFQWSDDPDLPPIPTLDSKPKEGITQNDSRKAPNGLKNSKWAHNKDLPSPPVIEEKHETVTHEQLSKEPLNNSHNAQQGRNVKPFLNIQMLEQKFKRELALYGAINPSTAKSSPLPPQPTPRQPTPRQPTTRQPTTRPTPQLAPKPVSNASQWNAWASTNGGDSRRPHNNRRRAEAEKPREPPRVKFDWEEFHREVKAHNPKTLKDSRWADKGGQDEKYEKKEKAKKEEKEEVKPREPPPVIFDWEEFHREVRENNLKTLKDSRWADKDEKEEKEGKYAKEEKHMKHKKHEKEEEKPREPPLVIFDWEEFNREVKENNLKTLKDSRWAD
ncbi:hypothetical protein GGS24DRAFT_510955 [Hypoxylon argillaceum]|nr:hypothetical protein GGS24DRAFT_510955 [Hypoxylon argillaceum]